MATTSVSSDQSRADEEPFCLILLEGIMLEGGERMRRLLERIKTFEVRPKDTFVVTYPKAGTTWLQQIVLLVTGRELTKDKTLEDVFPFIDLPVAMRSSGLYSLDEAEAMPDPRLIKSHLPVKYFKSRILKPDAPKFLVCMRNPKDTLVSLFHFYRMNGHLHFHGNWDEFFKRYEEKMLLDGDIFDHYVGWWGMKDQPNVKILKYEDMKADLPKAIKSVAAFLDIELTEDRVREITAKSSFEHMTKHVILQGATDGVLNEKISKFYRKGTVGDWRNHFSEDQSKIVDDAIRERLVPIGLHFEYN